MSDQENTMEIDKDKSSGDQHGKAVLERYEERHGVMLRRRLSLTRNTLVAACDAAGLLYYYEQLKSELEELEKIIVENVWVPVLAEMIAVHPEMKETIH